MSAAYSTQADQASMLQHTVVKGRYLPATSSSPMLSTRRFLSLWMILPRYNLTNSCKLFKLLIVVFSKSLSSLSTGSYLRRIRLYWAWWYPKLAPIDNANLLALPVSNIIKLFIHGSSSAIIMERGQHFTDPKAKTYPWREQPFETHIIDTHFIEGCWRFRCRGFCKASGPQESRFSSIWDDTRP